jgi:hypothetical protein
VPSVDVSVRVIFIINIGIRISDSVLISISLLVASSYVLINRNIVVACHTATGAFNIIVLNNNFIIQFPSIIFITTSTIISNTDIIISVVVVWSSA